LMHSLDDPQTLGTEIYPQYFQVSESTNA
jgi:hypothetical protein